MRGIVGRRPRSSKGKAFRGDFRGWARDMVETVRKSGGCRNDAVSGYEGRMHSVFCTQASDIFHSISGENLTTKKGFKGITKSS